MEGKVLLGQSLIWAIILLGQIHGYESCTVKERNALLELKKHVSLHSIKGGLSLVLPTWNNDTKSDCCRWWGVKCNRTSRRVTKLSLGKPFFLGTSLLNLSLLHPFEEVQSLDLSESSFNGLFDDVEGYQSLRRLRNLEILDLSSNMFDNSIFLFLNAATSLTTLFLGENYMDGPFPVKELKDLTNLEMLDLSDNMFNGSMPVREFSYLKKLKSLNLGVFCEMENLRELDLGGNYFVGQLPMCLGRLKKLRFLDLSSNQLSGNLPSSFSGLESLEYLSLLDNSFQGFFSLNPLASLTNLKVFKISSTSSDMVKIETESTWQPKFQLSVAVLRFCSLEEIPYFLVYQKNLRLVDLSGNRLSGNIPTWLLENNPKLQVLKLTNNSFTSFQMSTMVHDLQVLDFSENHISGLFPGNIGKALPSLVYMNGSKNGLQGNLPSSMGVR
ncbi:unnamed protein product [Microthlaspi erraticum]|uniref:Leucine-rich repeat-containing N-terminal plant-type domain-containing protein n=1 Tax=Microthlaspi erraticum TaxID=1685480 RepID=A0A6D2KR08_9BRAS|nr:unnamed protein product [Microthlaspi erraticum]